MGYPAVIRGALCVTLLLSALGCGAAATSQKSAQAPTPKEAPSAEVAATPSVPEAPPGPPVLADEVEAGNIPRPALLAVLSGGAGRFLQRVRTEPHLVHGRFVGWRLVGLFEREPDMQGGVLQPGDTVLRVNGQSIERPEQFMNVWQSLATESDLVLHVERAGKQSQLRYHIVDDKLSAAAPTSSSTRKPTSPSISTSSP